MSGLPRKSKQKPIDARAWPLSVKADWCKESNFCGYTSWTFRTKDNKEYTIKQHWILTVRAEGPAVHSDGFSIVGSIE